MFRSKTRQRQIFSKRRRNRRFSWLGTIASIALVLLALELLTRIFLDLSGDRSKYTQAKAKSALDAYQLNFVSSKIAPREEGVNSLLAQSKISVGYGLVGNQQNQLWQINKQGFRDREDVPLAKPAEEVRIFLLGNSTAFGYGNPNNSSTISAQLEARLQQRLQQQQASPKLYQPDLLPFNKAERQKSLAKPAKIKPGNYRIINAAVPGYASGNEMAQVALEVLQYKPDLIVILDGYQDLMLPSDRQATTIPQTAIAKDEQTDSLGAYVDRLVEPLQKHSYLARVASKSLTNSPSEEAKTEFILDESTVNLVKHLPQDNAELQARADRYLSHQKQMLNLSAAAKVPLVVALQPEITGRNPNQLTASEGKIATELGRKYIRQVKDSYPTLIAAAEGLAQAYPSNMKVLDLYQLTDKYPSPSFIDAIHLNQAANEKVAEQLYYGIASMPKMQVTPKQAPKPAPVYPRRNRRY